jgi:hypothetical protein
LPRDTVEDRADSAASAGRDDERDRRLKPELGDRDVGGGGRDGEP